MLKEYTIQEWMGDEINQIEFGSTERKKLWMKLRRWALEQLRVTTNDLVHKCLKWSVKIWMMSCIDLRFRHKILWWSLEGCSRGVVFF